MIILRCPREVWAVLPLALLFVGLCAAQTSVIFSNITGPCGGCSAEEVAGSRAPVPQESWAAQFTPTITGQATGARVVVSSVTYGPSPSFNLAIFSDAGGVPGAPVSQTINLTAPSDPGGTVTALFSQPVVLEAETPYWLVLTPAATSTFVFWYIQGSTYVPVAATVLATGLGGWVGGSENDLQFAVDGTPLSSALAVTTNSLLPNGTVGLPYSETLAATGGTPPYTNWMISSGVLPPGLSLNANGGVISGTPTTAASEPFDFSVTVQDSAADSSPAHPFSLSIVSGVMVTTTALPGGAVGVAYSQTLAASGGTPPYRDWTVAPGSGSLPNGLNLNSSSGIISGTPTVSGAFSFSVTVSDSAGNVSPAEALSINIAAIFDNITGPCMNCLAHPINGSGAITGDTQAQSSAGQFTPSVARIATGAQVVVESVSTEPSSALFNVTIFSDASGLPGVPLSLTAMNLAAPYSPNQGGIVTAAFGAPVLLQAQTPYWLVLTPANTSTIIYWLGGGTIGVSLAGTESATGLGGWNNDDGYNFDAIQFAVDGTAPSALAITTSSPMPRATVGVAYSLTLSATGGTPPYSTWMVVPGSGSLPNGLTLNSSIGVISGTPTASGTFSFSVTVTDSAGTVSPAKALTVSVAVAATIAPPSINPGGVVSASAFGEFTSIAPGSWIEIYGSNLAAATRSWTTTDFKGIKAPTSLDGTSVTIAGLPAYVSFISPGQVNVQVPSVPTGPQPLVVTAPGGSSNAYTVTVNTQEPGFLAPASFILGGKQYVASLFPDYTTFAIPTGAIANVPSRPAQPGDALIIYGVGFGDVSPDIPPGEIVQEQNMLAAPFNVYFGDVEATVQYDGLSPGYVGLYQFNVVVPDVPASNLVPLTFTLGGNPGTQTLYIAVESGS